MQQTVQPRRCGVCKRPIQERHGEYPGLCAACGDLCHSKRLQQANLESRVALVTGARVGIGYATVLKLLRNGASVIGTTRFPPRRRALLCRRTRFP